MLGAAPGEAGGGGPLLSNRSNVRHIKGILPVVYAPRYMDMDTRSANEIMFATGNANKLKEVLLDSYRSLAGFLHAL